MSRKILVAVELDELSVRCVLDKVAALLAPDDTFELLHVVDPTTVAYTADPTMTGSMYRQMSEAALQAAERRLRILSEPYDITPAKLHVRYGRIAHEVHSLLADGGFDTLMIGSHGWSGWRRILGSRAASILHGVPVNTWVFKVEKSINEPIKESE